MLKGQGTVIIKGKKSFSQFLSFGFPCFEALLNKMLWEGQHFRKLVGKLEPQKFKNPKPLTFERQEILSKLSRDAGENVID